jgi:hypothetical protein
LVTYLQAFIFPAYTHLPHDLSAFAFLFVAFPTDWPHAAFSKKKKKKRKKNEK